MKRLSIRSARGCRPVGFTLLELMTVMAIMVIIMMIAITSFYNLRRGAEMRSAVNSMRVVLALARQNAVTMREKTWACFRTNDSSYFVRNSSILLGETNFLPVGIHFVSAPSDVVFSPSGGAGSANNFVIKIMEVIGSLTNRIVVSGLTGLIRVE